MSKAKKIAIICDDSGNISGTNISGTNTGDQVIPVASSTIPANLGTAAIGTGITFARADHVHQIPILSTLTFGDGLSGTSYNTSSAVTIAINTATTVDKTTAQTLTNKSLSDSTTYFIDKTENLGVKVIVGIIVRDEDINTEQQKRLRKGRTLDIALDEYSNLSCELNYLSLESLFLHKQNYLKWVSKVIDFPLDYSNPNILKFLDTSPNKKYVKYVEEYWLDDIVKKGLTNFENRRHSTIYKLLFFH